MTVYLTFLWWRWEKLHLCSKTGKEVLQEKQCILQRTPPPPKKGNHSVIWKTGKCVAHVWYRGKTFTWSILRRRGVSETRKQHSCGAWLDSGHMWRALTVNWERKQNKRTQEFTACRHWAGLIPAWLRSTLSTCLSHHIWMSFSGHFLAWIQVKELIHLWGS